VLIIDKLLVKVSSNEHTR